jgi:hypothetical protein
MYGQFDEAQPCDLVGRNPATSTVRDSATRAPRVADAGTGRATPPTPTNGRVPDHAGSRTLDARPRHAGTSTPRRAAAATGGHMTDRTATADTGRRYARLRRWNLGIGAVHLAQAVVLVVLANDLTLPVLASLLTDDPVQGQPPQPELAFELPIAATVALFVLLAAADHLGRNTARWVEYSVSSSVMIVLIAAFVGIWDLAALVAIFGVNTSMILFGLLWERTASPGRGADWSAYWFGTFAGAVPWAIIVGYVLAADGVPGFVYVIVGVQLALFWSFAVNMALQYARIGPWRDYLFGEYGYLVLSLAAKTLLAWLIFANVLRT